jgi:hypothetical protein
MIHDVRAAVYGLLADSDDLTDLLATPASIFHRLAPAKAQPPFVVFDKTAGTPSYNLGGPASQLPVQNDLWTIVATDSGRSASNAEAIADEIELAVAGKTVSIAGQTPLYLQRDSDLDYGDASSDGTEWHYVGGIYRLITQRAEA